VVGNQNYDVEYTLAITLHSVPARATYTFDPPDGGGSFGASFTAVPEPSSCALLALGGLMLCAYAGWKRRHFKWARSMR
jgi:hypothetical protein